MWLEKRSPDSLIPNSDQRSVQRLEEVGFTGEDSRARVLVLVPEMGWAVDFAVGLKRVTYVLRVGR